MNGRPIASFPLLSLCVGGGVNSFILLFFLYIFVLIYILILLDEFVHVVKLVPA